MSRREFYNLFSINRKAKYFQSALENRKQYETFLQAKGEISVGERVSCRASPEAMVTAIDSDDTVTVKLLPYGNEKNLSHFPMAVYDDMSRILVFMIAKHDQM